MRAVEGFGRSSSFKMAAMFALLLIMVLAMMVYFMIIATDETIVMESEAAIESDLSMLSVSEQLRGIDYIQQVLSSRIADPNNSYLYALKAPDDSFVMGNIEQWPETAKDVPREGLVLTEVQPTSNQSFQDILAKMQRFDNGYTVLVGRRVDNLETASWVAITFGWVVIAIVIFISATSFAIGIFVVRRINSISSIADEIMQNGSMSVRIPMDSTWDDLSKLAAVLNSMLDEIESLLASVRQVTDNIAHDMRTPLTRLRNTLEGLEESQNRDELLKEADTLLAMFNGLLRIAEIETAKRKSGFSNVAFADIVHDAIALYQPIADDKDISIQTDITSTNVFGDRDLLFQCCINIIDNAIKFTPAHGRISVRLTRKQQHAHLAVCDSGPGIASNEQAEIFRRLYRGDSSRNTEGYGLGLSLVDAVVRLHDGSITLADNKPGLCFQLAVPIHASDVK